MAIYSPGNFDPKQVDVALKGQKDEANKVKRSVGHNVIISVPDVETYNKINRVKGFPNDGHYKQTHDIDGSKLIGSGTLSNPFDGIYDGQNYTVSHLRGCMFKYAGNYALVKNVNVTGAYIISNVNNRYASDPGVAVMVCTMVGPMVLTDNYITSAIVTGRARHTEFGVVVGKFNELAGHHGIIAIQHNVVKNCFSHVLVKDMVISIEQFFAII